MPKKTTPTKPKTPAGEVLDVAKILEVWNPFEFWDGSATEAKIRKALAKEDFADHIDENKRRNSYHARRIAYLVKHGWDEPILVDVGCGPYGGHFMIDDGNHRFCAAVIRGDKSIKASTAGMVSIIKEFEYKG